MTLLVRQTQSCGCDRTETRSGLLTLEDALRINVAGVKALPGVQSLPLEDAVGRCLAEPVLSQTDSPPFTNSAVDGYAVDALDFSGMGPWAIPLTTRIAAGDSAPLLASGTAARIFTGAPLPEGANSVVMQEDTEAEEGRVVVRRLARAGDNVRYRGEDMAQGDTVLEVGRRLSGRDIGLAAAAGARRLVLRRPVRVALLVTGSEVITSGQDLGAGQIRDINGPLLQAALSGPMIERVAHISLGDSLEDIAAAMATLSEKADLVVTTGGVSVGEEDHLHRAFEMLGGTHQFAGVAVKPGKPISRGVFANGAQWLGLPGNPTAAYVGWHVFGRALVAVLSGEKWSQREIIVTSAQDIHHKPGRCELRPARLAGFDDAGRILVTTVSTTQSGRVRPLAEANGVLVIPAEDRDVPKGAQFKFLPFEDQ